MHIVIVTGLSGAGKSTALRALEDYGFYCVDNVPLPLIQGLVQWLVDAGDVPHLALSLDARQARYLEGYAAMYQHLLEAGHSVDVLYLDADDDRLVSRFSATRRSHPLSDTDLVAGIAEDRRCLSALRKDALIIDTSELNVHELKAVIQDHYGAGHGTLTVVLLSFGFKHGVPREANLLFDVRFLRNPYFDDELRACDGRDPAVSAYVFESREASALTDQIEALLRFTLPEFHRERKLYLTVAIGCTGGRHRSVAMVEELARRIADDWDVLIKHRDLDLRN